MKLITLNIWGGRVHKPLLNFIKEQNGKIDIFCFQEVFKSEKNFFSREIKTDVFSDLKDVLKDYNAYYAPVIEKTNLFEKVDFEIFWGQATFVKKSIKVLSEGNVFIFGEYNHKWTFLDKNPEKYIDTPRLVHYIVIKNRQQKVLIANLHGFWIPDSKEDTLERLEQSDKIINFLNSYKHRKILCGDFNLNPNTQSMLRLEKGMVNLIKKYNVRSTRSNLHTRKDKYADYILVSKDIEVLDFKVLQDEVSDHLPLFLDFN
ncbi:MAG: endonuclease/exonuclease/phosphatase family protein [Patescibacteria group bacterium]|nr:endonuclease/exonuclease/phosphatase family protein [Patescibacteria group bacterium]